MGSSATDYIEAPYLEKEPKKISIQTFLRKYRKGGPGVKYEFNNGIIEKTEAMKLSEQYIADNIFEKFEQTPAAKQRERLVQELEIWTSHEQFRKPDLCVITQQQIAAAAEGKETVPEFMIEVISPSDKVYITKTKIAEYFAAGVKILWQIFPSHQLVEVYRSPTDIQGCAGEDVCSAEPVVKGFKMKVSEIFKKP